MRHVIIDCDPGHDDILALVMALANDDQMKVEAITTNFGNASLENVTRNLLSFLELAQVDIPVAKGAAQPLVGNIVDGTNAHGETGLGGVELYSTEKKVLDTFAPRYMAEIIEATEVPIDIIALGPLTNVSLLLSTYPELHKKINAIYFMGGGINGGNMTSMAEFNTFADPEAAHIVFHSGLPLYMAGLDIQDVINLHDSEWNQLKGKGKFADFIYHMMKFYHEAGKEFGFNEVTIYDASIIYYYLNPKEFETASLFVDVELNGLGTRGMTFADRRKRPDNPPNMNVLLNCNRDSFAREMIDSIEKLNQRIES